MKVIGVIPARYGSSRFPGKPLAKIAGKTLITRVIEGVRGAKSLDEILVATDDERIAEEAKRSGVSVAMTDSDLPSGTDRIWQAIQDRDCDLALNIQGDEPLIRGELIDQLVEPFESDSSLEMATLGRALKEGDLDTDTTAKITLNNKGEALYFSRLPIPYSREKWDMKRGVSLKHIGIYAYRRSFLKAFCECGPTELELAEGLEQLRALYLGARIKVVEVNAESWGVDTPEDVLRIEKLLAGEDLNAPKS